MRTDSPSDTDRRRSAPQIASRTASAATNGALGVVLVGDWRAEDRDDRIADELLDRAAEALDLGLRTRA